MNMVYVTHVYVLLKLLGVLKAIIASSTVRHEPSHLPCLVSSIVLVLLNLSYRWIVVLPFLIRGDYVAVFSGIKEKFGLVSEKIFNL